MEQQGTRRPVAGQVRGSIADSGATIYEITTWTGVVKVVGQYFEIADQHPVEDVEPNGRHEAGAAN